MREIFRDDIKFTLDEEDILRRLHCERDDEPFERFTEMSGDILPLCRPAFIIREVPIESAEHDGFTSGGQFFGSRIASHKLKDCKTAFVYAATCGRAISDYVESLEDELDAYIADQAAYMAYRCAMQAMSAAVESEWGIDKYVMLCPGSIIDWSVGDVRKIFTLLDGLTQRAGLRVLDSGMIDPLKSTSGFIYPTNEEFESCEICPRASCPNRRAPFNEDKHEEMQNL